MKNDIKWKKLIYLFIIFIITLPILGYIEINFPSAYNIYRNNAIGELSLNIIIFYFFYKIVFDNLENYKNYKRNTKIFIYFIGSWIMGRLVTLPFYKFFVNYSNDFDLSELLLAKDKFDNVTSYVEFFIMIIPLVISILYSLKNRKKIWYRAMNIVSSFFVVFQTLIIIGCCFYLILEAPTNSTTDTIMFLIYGTLTAVMSLILAMFFRLLSVNTYKYFKLKRSVKD